MKTFSLLAISCLLLAWVSTAMRTLMYLTGQHPIIPDQNLVKGISHVALAFMPSSIFNALEPPAPWELFLLPKDIRPKFAYGTKILIAIGGWGDTAGFEAAARTEENREKFANNLKAMVEATDADGVDVDWEYPGGNGEDYKQTPNSAKAWEIEVYPLLLNAIRNALGPAKIISAAVPGKVGDMLAFGSSHLPYIAKQVDFLNIMTYDLMNRRDNITKHHTGIQASLEAVDAYLANGILSTKINLGFAFYIKWYRTDPGDRECLLAQAVGCKTVLMEDPDTGADLGNAGAFSWHDEVPAELNRSYQRAMVGGTYDTQGGGWYYWDATEDLWWSWDTPDVMKRKLREIVFGREYELGGVFAWGLGEDAPKFDHLKALRYTVTQKAEAFDEL